jgi:nitrous oxidase accessory protein
LDNSQVIGNVVYGQNRGFFIQQAAMNRFENNIIATNDIGVYLSNGSEQNVFVGNAFVRNIDHVWQPPFDRDLGSRGPNAFYEDRRGNYWSDYAGADADGNGLGDTPYHETDVYGYVVDRYPEAKVFALSPAVSLLRKTEELLPVLDLPGITDLFPLMRPATRVR